jgi:hypothetical protein
LAPTVQSAASAEAENAVATAMLKSTFTLMSSSPIHVSAKGGLGACAGLSRTRLGLRIKYFKN